MNGSMDWKWLWFERNWGLHLRYSSPSHQSKSPLWAHLMAYAETQGKEEFVSPLSPSTSSPPHPLTSSMSSLAFLSTGASESALLQTHTHLSRYMYMCFPSPSPFCPPIRVSGGKSPFCSEPEGPLPQEEVPVPSAEGSGRGHPSPPSLLPHLRPAVSSNPENPPPPFPLALPSSPSLPPSLLPSLLCSFPP